jgi:hypothetical protein
MSFLSFVPPRVKLRIQSAICQFERYPDRGPFVGLRHAKRAEPARCANHRARQPSYVTRRSLDKVRRDYEAVRHAVSGFSDEAHKIVRARLFIEQ